MAFYGKFSLFQNVAEYLNMANGGGGAGPQVGFLLRREGEGPQVGFLLRREEAGLPVGFLLTREGSVLQLGFLLSREGVDPQVAKL